MKQITIQRWSTWTALLLSLLPLLIAAFSISPLAILFLYLVGENCNCQNF